MRNFTKIILLLVLTGINQTVCGQAMEATNRLNLRGPVPPVDTQYGKYKSYELILELSPGLENSYNIKKVPFSAEKFTSNFFISGLKKTNDGDFKIKYNLTRFELVNDEDYLETYYQKAPAYYIGLESNLEISDKSGKVIYKRYTTPKVCMYVTNPTETYERLSYKIVNDNFNAMIAEFEGFYLYGPAISNLKYVDIEKKKKSKSKFNTDEFNTSVQVLPNLVDVDRENWLDLFGEAQNYWKEFVAFQDKEDEDLAKKVRFTANYNLVATNILLGQIDEANKYMPGVKENEKSFLGMRTDYPYLTTVIEEIDRYKKITEKASTIEAIQAEPVLASYKKSATAFRYAEFDGEVLNVDSEVFKGKVRIISDFPELVDLRTEQTVSGLRSMMDGIGSEKSSVRIYVEGEKKPKKTNLKKVVNIKDNEGRMYIVGKAGRGVPLVSVGAAVDKVETNTKRYSLFEEVKKGAKVSLYHEFFPQDDYSLKKPTQDEFFTPPVFLGRRKALKEYFSDCPKMIESIDKGVYDFENKETYIKMYDDYTEFCGNS
ncbi:hypothetical protein FLSI110296_11010 [Flavobacterium sinopsychrotolerans]|uniref:Uncharacterized protein n=1 Tax=Flavobacterium sinopsychrotolerans TaxID=604089 RepID=A0A1H8P831_9FLAO|nr:hypothetical protein [Flavobacterium sinopsychrotolerans]SEO37798.1 hypothetical protein SAMN04487942_2569 [Flavobacterium sinopsychrotolerans]